MKAILRKDKCLAAIGERLAEVTDNSKWDEMDGNAIANLHLALADGVLSSIKEKKSLNSLSCKIDPQKSVEILLLSLYDSYDKVVLNLTSNVLSDYIVIDDVATSILEEEDRRNNREDMQTTSRQVEALVVTRGSLIEHGSSGSHNHKKSELGKKKNLKCFKCGKPSHFRKNCREPEDVIEVEDTVEPEDEIVPDSVHEIASLSRRLCGRETAHALVEKKEKGKDNV
nr:hypothetical protein [Tanacetum cinerariifolium]